MEGQSDQTESYDDGPYVERLLTLIELLADDLDHPELWQRFKNEAASADGEKDLLRLHALLVDITPDQT